MKKSMILRHIRNMITKIGVKTVVGAAVTTAAVAAVTAVYVNQPRFNPDHKDDHVVFHDNDVSFAQEETEEPEEKGEEESYLPERKPIRPSKPVTKQNTDQVLAVDKELLSEEVMEEIEAYQTSAPVIETPQTSSTPWTPSPTVEPEVSEAPDVPEVPEEPEEPTKEDTEPRPAYPALPDTQEVFTSIAKGTVLTEDQVRITVETPQNSVHSPTLNYPCIYRGESLNGWTVLYANRISVEVDGEQYLVTDDRNPNVQIEGYPEVAQDDFTATIRVRPNEDSAWIIQTFPVHVYDAKVQLLGREDEELLTWYMDEEDELSLLAMDQVLRRQADAPMYAQELFTGWSLEKNGDPVGDTYSPSATGVSTLYLREYEPIPEGMTVVIEEMNDGSQYAPLYIQKLVSYRNLEDGVLKVPEGIYSVDVTADGNIPVLIVPSSMRQLSIQNGLVTDRFIVDERNSRFQSTPEGVILNRAGNALLAVPLNLGRYDVPASITTISAQLYTYGNCEFHFTASVPPAFLMNQLITGSSYNAGISFVVPEESYQAYLDAWQPDYRFAGLIEKENVPSVEQTEQIDESNNPME